LREKNPIGEFSGNTVVEKNMKENPELEWQFSAAHLDKARQWLAAQPSQPSERHLAVRSALQLVDTYYDSTDWMIFRAGFALRLRRQRADDSPDETSEITLKSLHESRAGFAHRTEISQRVDSADIDAALAKNDGIGERIRELIGIRELTPLFKARTHRERQQLLEAGTDLPLAEVDLDETVIEVASGATCQFTRVEVECIHATPAALEPFVEQLRDAAQLRPVEASKFRAGLNVAGLDPSPAPASEPVTISGSQPFAVTQFALLRKYFAEVFAREPLVRAGSVTSVHEMRVAARHLDVLLRVFKGFGPRWAVGSRTTLRAIINALGAVRDCDVQLAYLRTSAELPGAERDSINLLRLRLGQQREKARVRLLHLLDSDRTRGWIELWVNQLRLGTASGARARQVTTAVVARDLIRSLARKLRKRADRLEQDPSADNYHETRIRAKRLRYALDAFGSLYGDAASEYSRVLARLQDVLGEYHDSTVRSEKFTELVTTGRRVPASTSFMVGRLVERDQRAFDQCRRKFPKAYRRTRRSRWRGLLEAMREQAEAAERAPDQPPSA
jgi:CHAD domain-containing protein